jgi:hypothetical protein
MTVLAAETAILNVLAEKLSRTSKDDFERQNFENWLIVQALGWHALSAQLPRSEASSPGAASRARIGWPSN